MIPDPAKDAVRISLRILYRLLRFMDSLQMSGSDQSCESKPQPSMADVVYIPETLRLAIIFFFFLTFPVPRVVIRHAHTHTGRQRDERYDIHK
jgi:hypothetical protein